MAYQQPTDVLMGSEQPDAILNREDNENGCSSIRDFQFVHRGPFIYNEVREYFQQFGEIESMQINSKSDVHYGYVRVEMTAMDAKVILSNVSHHIADCMVNIGEVNFPDDRISIALHPLSVPTDQEATNHILVLNDDCLRNVLERLNLTDLVAASDVCIRFNQVAKDVFGTIYRDSTYYAAYIPATETYLRNFGPLIESLKIDENLLGIGTFDRTTDVICMIAKRCCNVKELTISSVKINQEFKPLQPIFAKLEQFCMDEVKYDCVEEVQEMDATMTYLLSVCDDLKTLHLYSDEFAIRNPLKCIVQKFPSLQAANITHYSGVEDDTLEQFFILNPTLKKLDIFRTNEKSRSTKVFRCIGQHLVNLTELEIYENLDTSGFIEDHQNDIQFLSSLSSLKALRLDFCSLSVTPLMESLAANGVPIGELEIYHGSFDSESIKSNSKLKQIKILRIFYTKMTDDYLIELAKELPLLSDLHLEHGPYDEFDISAIGITKAISYANRLSDFYVDCRIRIKISMDDYNAMLKSVLNRTERIKLKIFIGSTAAKLNVSETILNRNRDWLDFSWFIYNTEESVGDSDDSDDPEMELE